MIKNSNKNHYLALSLMILFSFSVTILIFSPISFINMAKALNSSDYNKLTGESLGVADWNRLDSDFVAKSGDTMTGPINMANNTISSLPNPSTDDQAVNRGSMNSAIAGAISSIPSTVVNTSGTPLKIVCGETIPSDWLTYGSDSHSVYVDVDMTSAGFTSVPYILTTLNGNSWHWRTYGVTSIYNPTTTGFRVYIYNTGTTMVASDASTWGWYISWCGISS